MSASIGPGRLLHGHRHVVELTADEQVAGRSRLISVWKILMAASQKRAVRARGAAAYAFSD